MSFVRKMATSPNDRAIVQTMCALAEGLQLTVVAEDIEDENTQLLLTTMGCRYGQGYHFAKALPRMEAEEFIVGETQQGRPATSEPLVVSP